VDAVAGELALPPQAVTDGLYADLKENHVLVSFDAIDAEALVAKYETSSRQSALLRAVRVVVTLEGARPGAYRQFFRKLKFRRLLYALTERPDGGYRIEIDGPFSLFRTVTKYGLQLALLLPALDECGRWKLEADILWGADRQPLTLNLAGGECAGEDQAEPGLPDEVEQLRARFAVLESDWSVDAARELLDLPGIGLCVPDLVFRHGPSGRVVYLEVMGYWSRAAVWQRVELVEAGLPHAMIFAVSSRLRVSEEALHDDLPSQLYVYKGVMSAKAIAARLPNAGARRA
jgi:predicted nuclease of restriction endonuclease-like RecB superfamily